MGESDDGKRDEPLVSPDLDAEDRRVLAANTWALVPRSEPARAIPVHVQLGPRDAASVRALAMAAGTFLALAASAWMVAFVAGSLGSGSGYPEPTVDGGGVVALLDWIRSVCALLAGLSATGVAAVFLGQVPAARRHRRIAARAAELHGRYLLPDQDLAGRGRALLARARTAARAITSTAVHRDDLIDAADHNARLDSLLWSLGEQLADLERAKARIDESVRDGGKTGEAVAKPHRAALEERYQALETRVAALEDYASKVADLDEAYRASTTAQELDDLAIELQSDREVRDEAELSEIKHLAGQLSVPEALVHADLDEQIRRTREQFGALERPA